MSYTVLARKWRPQTFDEVVGQDHVVKTLQNALKNSRISHAYLFCGARGVGKTTVARLLAKSLNCDEGPAQNPCNKCPSCHGITSGNSIDVIEIDGASNTGVDDVREIKENIRYRPSMGKYKIYIIDEVHMLSINAFNALLKTLEEPPPNTAFIFATTEPHKIPLTIVSRCQRFDFRRIGLKKIVDQLSTIADAEGVDIDARGLHLIAREADGSMRDSQSLFDQIVSAVGLKITEKDVADTLGLLDKGIIQDISLAIIKKETEQCIKIIEKAYEFGYDEKRFWQEIIVFLRDAILLKTVDNPEGLVGFSKEDIKFLKETIEEVSIEELHTMLQVMIRGFEDFARTTYPKLALEVTVLRIVNLPRLASLKELFSRIEALEKKYGSYRYGNERGVPSNSSAYGAETYLGRPLNGSKKETVIKSKEDCVGRVEENATSDMVGYNLEGGAGGIDWKGLLMFISKKKPSLYAHMEYSRPVFFDGKCLKLDTKKGIHYDYLSEADTLSILEDVCGSFFKKPVRVIINDVKDPAISDNRVEEGLKKSFVKDVIDVFGGTMHHIK